MDLRDAGPQLPWWRLGIVWLVLAGPAAVVVAGIATALLAMHGADPVLRPRTATPTDAAAPAQQARNHAASARGEERR
jgi:hypothetical protein